MKKHIKIYRSFFDYGEQDFTYSELSGQRASDVHHIEARGMGGSKEKDHIENLIGLTREEHDLAENGTYSKEFLKEVHTVFVNFYKKYGHVYTNGIWVMRRVAPDMYKKLLE